MNFQTKKYKEYLAQDYRPVMLSEMPFVVDHRALRDYARSKGVAIASLSDEEKKQFLRPNPEYTAATVHPLITFAKNAVKSFVAEGCGGGEEQGSNKRRDPT